MKTTARAALLLLPLFAACAPAQDDQPIASNQEALAGNPDYDASCRPTFLPFIRESVRRARTAVNSSAFSQCLNNIMSRQLTFHGHVVGPYSRCSSDPQPTTAASIVALLRSSRQIKASCDETKIGTSEGGSAWRGSATATHESFTFASMLGHFAGCASSTDPSCVSTDAYAQIASVLVHEVLHTHSYDHPEEDGVGGVSYTCGSTYPDPRYAQSIPYMVDACVETVLAESARCDSSVICPEGRRLMLRALNADNTVASPVSCECVADPGLALAPDRLDYSTETSNATIYNWSDEQQFLAADFDGDGLTDVAQAYRLWGSIPICLSLGRGWACGNPSATIQNMGPNQEFVVGDFNGDRRAEILAADPSKAASSYSIYRWSPSARGRSGWSTISAPATIYQTFSPRAQTLIGDFDGDGKSDVFQAWDGWSSIPVCRSRNNGTSFDCINPGATIYVGTPEAKFLTGDFDGDGKTDVYQVDRTWASIPVCRSTGSGFDCKNHSATIHNLANTAQDFLTGDFDGDGKTDVFQVNRHWQSIPVCRSTGVSWACSNLQASIVDSGSDAQKFIAADVNGDGRTDIVQMHRGWSYYQICYSNGVGWECERVPTQVTDSGFDSQEFFVGDVNGDLRGDVITAHRSMMKLPVSYASDR